MYVITGLVIGMSTFSFCNGNRCSANYRVCHRFSLTKQEDSLRVNFVHWSERRFLRQLGQLHQFAGAKSRNTITSSDEHFPTFKSEKREKLNSTFCKECYIYEFAAMLHPATWLVWNWLSATCNFLGVCGLQISFQLTRWTSYKSTTQNLLVSKET